MSFDFEMALERIEPFIRRTPLIPAGDALQPKAENRQINGSFKLRGALNKLLKVKDEEVKSGVLAASAGNHGLESPTLRGNRRPLYDLGPEWGCEAQS